jgi:outer membrane lipoprotein carrier protein LolA
VKPGSLRRVLLLVTLALAALPALAADWGIPQLMAQLAANPGGRARFVEKKHLAVLERPVESSGELVFTPPARLERHTLKPREETAVIDGEAVSLAREGKTLRLRLSDYPELSAVIGTIRSTLAGDQTALERLFLLSLSGSSRRWTLSLLPSDPQVAERVLRVQVEGSGGVVRKVEILQADGDRSVMDIQPIAGS